MIDSSGLARPVKSSRLTRSVGRFLQCEGGSSTVEFVLWVPLVIMVLMLIVDASMLFMTRSHAMRVLQDTNRLYSVGQFTGDTAADRLEKAEDYALARLSPLSESATAVTTELNRVVRTEATMQTSEIANIGFLGTLIDVTMTISAEHRVEF
jgi:Flp pilus assembly protein TadG